MATTLLSPSTSTDQRAYRLTSIDMVRGLVIVIMAIDHVRDNFLVGRRSRIRWRIRTSPLGVVRDALDHPLLRAGLRAARRRQRGPDGGAKQPRVNWRVSCSRAGCG